MRNLKFKRDIYKRMLEWKARRDSNSTPQSLEISGARQVGKTVIVNDFAVENYKQVLSINLGDVRHNKIVKEWEAESVDYLKNSDEFIIDFLKRFNVEFIDSPDTVIVIDEIQESSMVYRLVRQITRKMKSHLIITGSYLGKIVNDKEFFLPAGDTFKLRMDSLSFEEFLDIFGQREIYNSLDLYGNSDKAKYDVISTAFKVYMKTGGYPEVIKAYINTHRMMDIESVINNILDIFADESTRYFDSIVDKTVYRLLFSGVANLMLREKKGLGDLSNELVKLCQREGTSHISKQDVNHTISWLYQSNIIGFCNKCLECNHVNLVVNSRYYFTDIGVAYTFLSPLVKDVGTLDGILAENFVYLQLRDMIKEQRLLPETPSFGIYGDNEIDFLVCNRLGGTSYAVEVKSGKSVSKSVDVLLKDNKVDMVLYVKGDTYGGRNDRKITIPVYLFRRFMFEDFTGKSCKELEVPNCKLFDGC